MQASGRTFTRQIDEMPPKPVLDEIDAKVDMQQLEETLMREGLAKFADPQKALLKLIAAETRPSWPLRRNNTRVSARRGVVFSRSAPLAALGSRRPVNISVKFVLTLPVN